VVRHTIDEHERVRMRKHATTHASRLRREAPRLLFVSDGIFAEHRPKRSPARTQTRPKTFLGSAPRLRFTAAVYRTAIAEKFDAGLSLQRIWQDLIEEYRAHQADLKARTRLSEQSLE
jgi:hypothetical protein